MPLNMKKEIRAEIKILKGAVKKVAREFDREIVANLKAITQHERAIRQLTKRDGLLSRRLASATAKINRRILILEGRLA